MTALARISRSEGAAVGERFSAIHQTRILQSRAKTVVNRHATSEAPRIPLPWASGEVPILTFRTRKRRTRKIGC